VNGGPESLGWRGIVRLGFVQAALGAVVVLITSTLNRVMVVEYSLPAVLPGALVALHYAVQMIRPRFGYGSDRGGRRTPWILGGVALLAIGGGICAAATVRIAGSPALGLVLAVFGYALVGLGAGAAGTSLLVLMATQVEARRRAAAATIMWVLMIAGFAITATAAGHYLDPFSPGRLVMVTCTVGAIAMLVTIAALWNLEKESAPGTPAAGYERARTQFSFRAALTQVWSEPQSRRFTVFVFLSMLAYSAQELILEPFSGLIFGYTLGESTRLSGLQHAAVLLGMIAVGLACSGTRRLGSLRAWTAGGCIASALALLSLTIADLNGPGAPLRICIGVLGVANGVFAVAAIGSMMEFGSADGTGHAGVRMGLFGAAQAAAFALGGLFGTSIVDLIRHFSGSAALAFAVVFCLEAVLFIAAARFAVAPRAPLRRSPTPNSTAAAA
jgi:BCD family chlorophyll transporter-like MFS transporter